MDICLQIDKYSKSDLYDIFELKEKDVSQLNIQRNVSILIKQYYAIVHSAPSR